MGNIMGKETYMVKISYVNGAEINEFYCKTIAAATKQAARKKMKYLREYGEEMEATIYKALVPEDELNKYAYDWNWICCF